MIVVYTKRELEDLVDKRIRELGPNCDLNDIDVSGITDMSLLFYNTDFNGDISQWDVSNVKDMSFMFCRSKFNDDISRWNVTNVVDMCCTFLESRFNGDISNWNVCTTEVTSMFRESTLELNGKTPNWYNE